MMPRPTVRMVIAVVVLILAILSLLGGIGVPAMLLIGALAIALLID